MTSDVPVDIPAERRRTIVVIDQSEYRDVLRDSDRVDILDDPETQVVPFPQGDATQQLARLLRGQDLFRPGTLAVQSPYDPQRYVSADAALAEFTVEKFLVLARLAKILGATRLRFEDVRADRGKSTADGSLTIKTLATSVETSGSRSLEDDLKERLVGEHVFDGGPPDIEGARQLLASTRLASDPQLMALIDLRSETNPIKRQEIIFSGTREAAGNINAALRVVGGPAKFKIAGFSSTLKHHWENKIHVEVKTLIEF